MHAYVLSLGKEELPKRKKGDYYDDRQCDYARLLIMEMWKGKIVADTIKVYYTEAMICPAPPYFKANREIIGFLDFDKTAGKFSVHALSYGVKTVFGLQEVTLYKNRITEMLAILQQKESPEKQAATIEWLVTCAEQEATRWEGVYELSPHSDFMSYYDEDGNQSQQIYLSAAQRKRLFEVLMTITNPGYTDIGLADLCKGIDDDKLLGFYKTSLEKLAEETAWYADDYMARIVMLTNDVALKELQKKYHGLSPYDEKEKLEKQKLVQDFIQKMKTAELNRPLVSSGKLSV